MQTAKTLIRPSLIWVFAGRTVTLLVLSCCGSIVSVLSGTKWNPSFKDSNTRLKIHVSVWKVKTVSVNIKIAWSINPLIPSSLIFNHTHYLPTGVNFRVSCSLRLLTIGHMRKKVCVKWSRCDNRPTRQVNLSLFLLLSCLPFVVSSLRCVILLSCHPYVLFSFCHVILLLCGPFGCRPYVINPILVSGFTPLQPNTKLSLFSDTSW